MSTITIKERKAAVLDFFAPVEKLKSHWHYGAKRIKPVMIGDVLQKLLDKNKPSTIRECNFPFEAIIVLWSKLDFTKSLNDIFEGEVDEKWTHSKSEVKGFIEKFSEQFKNPQKQALLEFLEGVIEQTK